MPDEFALHNLLVDIAPHCSVCGALATRRYRDLAPDIQVFKIKMGELSKLAWAPTAALNRQRMTSTDILHHDHSIMGDIGRRTIGWVQRELTAIGEEIPNLAFEAEVEHWSFDQGPFFCDTHTGVYESLQYRDLDIAPIVRRATNVGLAATKQVRPTRFERILEDENDG
jgi:hypothetical protein